MSKYTIDLYETAKGYCPIETWLGELTPTQRRAVAAALDEVLAEEGQAVCGGHWGDPVGEGVFEFRIKHTEAQIRALGGGPKPAGKQQASSEKILLRIFCHAYGQRIVLLLGAYDKAKHDKAPYQQKQITLAKKRLKDFNARTRQKK